MPTLPSCISVFLPIYTYYITPIYSVFPYLCLFFGTAAVQLLQTSIGELSLQLVNCQAFCCTPAIKIIVCTGYLHITYYSQQLCACLKSTRFLFFHDTKVNKSVNILLPLISLLLAVSGKLTPYPMKSLLPKDVCYTRDVINQLLQGLIDVPLISGISSSRNVFYMVI